MRESTNRVGRAACAAVVALLLLSPSAHAQSGTAGTLKGLVRDATGAVLPGVTMKVRDLGTGAVRETVSDDRGRWTLQALQVGSYEVTHELPGFRKVAHNPVAVEAAVPRSLEVQLEVGIAEQTITVTSGADLVIHDTAATFRQIDSKELLQVPTSTPHGAAGGAAADLRAAHGGKPRRGLQGAQSGVPADGVADIAALGQAPERGQPGDGRLPDPCADGARRGERRLRPDHLGDRRRQPAHPPAQRRALRVRARPVHAAARQPDPFQEPPERQLLLQQLRFGGELKRHAYNTNLPEEQATEFEKFENFTQFLSGLATEGDTQFGITDKRFRMMDVSWYVADDWKVRSNLTLNLGLRWDWFGWPTERDGRIGNFDFAAMRDTENPSPAFLVPSNVRDTGFAAIDSAIAASVRVGNRHTLNGQDLDNLQPRFGFAYTPLGSKRVVVRGGYGIFYDRPSAAFMNTVFSNYPFLREIEVTSPSRAVPMDRAFSQQDPTFPLDKYLPNRLVYQSNGSYVIRDGTSVTLGADGSANPIDLATGRTALGNIAETFEFRAVDRGLRTPYVQQWNLGLQLEVSKDLGRGSVSRHQGDEAPAGARVQPGLGFALRLSF